MNALQGSGSALSQVNKPESAAYSWVSEHFSPASNAIIGQKGGLKRFPCVTLGLPQIVLNGSLPLWILNSNG